MASRSSSVDELVGGSGHGRLLSSGRRVVEAGEELLELRRRSPRRVGQRLVVGEQAGPPSSARSKASYCCSRPVTTSRDLVGVRDWVGDLDLRGLPGLLERSARSHCRPVTSSTPLEQRSGRLRVVELGEVVRDVRDEAHARRGPTPRAAARAAPGRWRAPGSRRARRSPARAGAGRSRGWSAHRPGVRHRHRHRRPARRRSATPKCSTTARTAAANASQRMSGSGPLSRRYGAPRRSSQQPHDQPGRLVVLVVVLDERHRRAAGPGSRRTRRRRSSPPPDRRRRADQVPRRQRRGVAGVEEAVERASPAPARRRARRARGRRRRCARTGRRSRGLLRAALGDDRRGCRRLHPSWVNRAVHRGMPGEPAEGCDLSRRWCGSAPPPGGRAGGCRSPAPAASTRSWSASVVPVAAVVHRVDQLPEPRLPEGLRRCSRRPSSSARSATPASSPLKSFEAGMLGIGRPGPLQRRGRDDPVAHGHLARTEVLRDPLGDPRRVPRRRVRRSPRGSARAG